MRAGVSSPRADARLEATSRVTDSDGARHARRAAADELLATVEDLKRAIEALRAENRLGHAARLRMRERIEETGGHEPDTLFGSWLDSDDRVSARLEHLLGRQERAADALRAHIAATELLLHELEPGRDDPRAGSG